MFKKPCIRYREADVWCHSDWFDCLDSKNRPVLNDREILSNLEAIVKDGDKTLVLQVRPAPSSNHQEGGAHAFHFRSPKMPWVSSPPSPAKSGLISAPNS